MSDNTIQRLLKTAKKTKKPKDPPAIEFKTPHIVKQLQRQANKKTKKEQ
jgi:hypothetical protein